MREVLLDVLSRLWESWPGRLALLLWLVVVVYGLALGLAVIVHEVAHE
jgi:hypothetical protein